MKKNILDELKVLAINGNKFHRTQDNLCILMGAGCKYYIHHLENGIIDINSTKPLTPSYLTPKACTLKYYKYETTINNILSDSLYHIDRLANTADGFGVMPTEDGHFT